MSGKEVREYTNLSDPKDRKWGKGKDKIDDEDITFQRMVAKHSMLALCAVLEDIGFSYRAVDLCRCRKLPVNVEDTFMGEAVLVFTAASLVDSSPAPLPLPLRVEPKPKSGIRQQDILKKIIQVMPKKQKVSSPSLLQSEHSNQSSSGRGSIPVDSEGKLEKSLSPSRPSEVHKISCSVVTNSPQREQEQEVDARPETTVKSLLGLAYESSDEE
ncbi:hypothetical protein ZIOFF_024093 [Zingiber officinale]|uniref:Uncharacterized protein n=1 Tax=Zingiber officinale TaxID=94328 RepID=A0A8J5GZY2_ZINOF|nr:hypothetical protein ZIOFF_024093 [Zingiber officinale]